MSLKMSINVLLNYNQKVAIAKSLSSSPVVRLYLILPLCEFIDLSPAPIILGRRWRIDGPRAGGEASTWTNQCKISVASNIVEYHVIPGGDRDSSTFPKCIDPEHLSPTAAPSVSILKARVNVRYSRAGSFPAGDSSTPKPSPTLSRVVNSNHIAG